MDIPGGTPRRSDASLDAPLYARILRDDWFLVAAPIRRAHAPLPVLRAHGHFHVEHGHHPVARLLARVLRLPPVSDAIDTRLIVTAHGNGERWERTFGTSRVETEQHEGPASDLVERFGLLEFRFHLEAADGSLRYVQRDVAFRWRSTRLRIPGFLAPRVDAREDTAGPGAGGVKVHVQVALPMVGPMMVYEGIIEVEVDDEDRRA
jgi:hypothetical protein